MSTETMDTVERLFAQRDKAEQAVRDIDARIRAALGISSETFKPRRKTISNDQFLALCGAAK